MSDAQRILFLTGKLAERSLWRTLESIESPGFEWQVHELGMSVAALMTADMIGRRLPDAMGADRVIVPGRCRGDLAPLAERYGVPVERGPDELKDLPEFFGRAARPRSLDQHDIAIFAEIVDAAELDLAGILARAHALRDEGADVIDIGCMPDTPFPLLADAVSTLKREGFTVSVDSMNTDELRAGGLAGADYLLSLDEHGIGLLDEVASTPVLVPASPGDLDSLGRAVAAARARGRDFIADPILDPIHFGLAASIARYVRFREREPDCAMMMGIGNVTELTHADTAGINMTLLGIASELHVGAVLTTRVSEHARSAIAEADRARRILFAARSNGELPKYIDDGLLMLHERTPFPDAPEDIAALAALVRDPNYRIQAADDGIHLYNRDGHHVQAEPFAFWPALDGKVDPSHAFYLGVELARAEIAHRLGKRFTQDEALAWGVALPRPQADLDHHALVGTTLRRRDRADPGAPDGSAAPTTVDDTR